MDITVFLIVNSDVKLPVIYNSTENCYYNPEYSLKKEMEDYGISGNIVKIEVDEPLPEKTESNLNLIIDSSLMLKEDTINHLISLNNMFGTAGVFCGPVFQNKEITDSFTNSKLISSYYAYDLDFGASEVCNITDEKNNFPSLIGTCVTREAYNSYPINPLHKGRYPRRDNKAFLSQVSKRTDIIYSRGFSKVKNLAAKDFKIESISNYYYNLGFNDGSLLALKNKKDKQLELWRRFVSSPELLDNELPRWLFRVTPEDGSEHLEQLVVLKCKYQIGFYEGMLGKNVL